MPRISGVIDFTAKTIGGSTALFSALAKHIDVQKMGRLFDNMNLDFIRNLPLDDVRRLEANELIDATKKVSKTERAKASAMRGLTALKDSCGQHVMLCAGGGLAAYAAYDSYTDLEAEKKTCLKMCMPEDWDDYNKGRIARPTYKTKDAVSPYDPTVKYELLYDNNKDYLCTLSNMAEDGIKLSDKDRCDQFCQSTCDYDLSDVLTNAVKKPVNSVLDGIKDIFGDIFGGNVGKIAMIVSGVICCLILLMIVLKIVKK